MLSPDQAASLVARHKATQAQITTRSGLIVLGIWDDLGSWNRADIERFEELTAPTISAAKKAAVTLAVGLYAAILQRRPPSLPIEAIEATFNSETPFTAVWHGLKEGRPFDEALASGRSTVDAELGRFVNSASRRTGDHVTEAAGVDVAWRRIPSAKACPWCVTVAGQLYKTSETADFGHDRCDCTAVPVAS